MGSGDLVHESSWNVEIYCIHRKSFTSKFMVSALAVANRTLLSLKTRKCWRFSRDTSWNNRHLLTPANPPHLPLPWYPPQEHQQNRSHLPWMVSFLDRSQIPALNYDLLKAMQALLLVRMGSLPCVMHCTCLTKAIQYDCGFLASLSSFPCINPHSRKVCV